MKAFTLWMFCTCILSGIGHLDAQENIIFTYNESGGLIERGIQVMPGGRIGNFSAPPDSLQYEFKVYPNPTSQFITVDGKLPENVESAELVLLNLNGQLLRKEDYAGQLKMIPVSGIKPGMYLLQVRYSKDQKSTYKIIVNN